MKLDQFSKLISNTHKVAGDFTISLKICTPSVLWFFCTQNFLGGRGGPSDPSMTELYIEILMKLDQFSKLASNILVTAL